MAVVTKASGEVRVRVDLIQLNRSVGKRADWCGGFVGTAKEWERDDANSGLWQVACRRSQRPNYIYDPVQSVLLPQISVWHTLGTGTLKRLSQTVAGKQGAVCVNDYCLTLLRMTMRKIFIVYLIYQIEKAQPFG